MQDPESWARLGRTIRQSREAQGYSRKALAELAQVSEKSIQVAEEGRTPRARWPQSLTLIEAGLGWPEGTMRQVLEGTLDQLPLFAAPADRSETLQEEITSTTPAAIAAESLKQQPSSFARSVVLAGLPGQIRRGLGEVFRFGRSAQNFGVDPDLVSQYEAVVEAIILDLASNRRTWEPSSDPGGLSEWADAMRRDPVLRRERQERERRLNPMQASARRVGMTLADVGQRHADMGMAVGGTTSEEVLAELRRLATEVSQLSQEVRGNRPGEDDGESNEGDSQRE